MGFALWIEENRAVAQATHEYRPIRAAVTAVAPPTATAPAPPASSPPWAK